MGAKITSTSWNIHTWIFSDTKYLNITNCPKHMQMHLQTLMGLKVHMYKYCQARRWFVHHDLVQFLTPLLSSKHRSIAEPSINCIFNVLRGSGKGAGVEL